MDFVRNMSSVPEFPHLRVKIVVTLDSWHVPRPGGQN
jgi:hypothetical protein